MSADSVVLEIFFARFPFGDPEINGTLWQEVDEQHFPVDLRQRLWRNGFRIGLIDGHVPTLLSRLLELEGKPSPGAGAGQTDLTDTEPQPRVLRRHLQIRKGRRGEIVASGIYDQLPVLLKEPGELCGQTYCQAQAMLALKSFPQQDGRVRVELVPELHHDEVRQTFVARQGMWRLEPGKPRRVFDELGVSATLAPGNMLVICSLPDLPGSLGHHFFTEDNGRLEQKLLLIRLAQTQQDGLFSPPEVLQLEE
ncbi:MAG: hypothetical protein JXB62_18795 [Pirellulales bacterium]|nr:hypothetical protein [Pirellulales bacterium]